MPWWWGLPNAPGRSPRRRKPTGVILIEKPVSLAINDFYEWRL